MKMIEVVLLTTSYWVNMLNTSPNIQEYYYMSPCKPVSVQLSITPPHNTLPAVSVPLITKGLGIFKLGS